jgi:hypothetical protein
MKSTMRTILWIEWFAAGVLTAIRALVLAIATPLLEKNAAKTVAARSLKVPVVFSMARVVVLAFAISMVHESWFAGIAGWPEATLSIAIVLTMPILSALERVTPKQAIELAKDMLGRFGVGTTRRGVENLLRREPSKHDDHRDDRRDADRDNSASQGEGEDDDALDPAA